MDYAFHACWYRDRMVMAVGIQLLGDVECSDCHKTIPANMPTHLLIQEGMRHVCFDCASIIPAKPKRLEPIHSIQEPSLASPSKRLDPISSLPRPRRLF